ncbi:MAG: 4Fe-4S binding protein [Actinobacteria bacterium]|nr:4Fe-4S binding protein [Actinomycetota bacterium]
MILKKENVQNLLDELSKSALVFVPKEVDGVLKFAPFKSADEMTLDIINTTLPPKDLLFPQTQKMYRYGIDADGKMYVDPSDDSAEQVVFGIRTCDMQSIVCMDDVFLTKGFVDEFYQAKRDKLLTVAIGCNKVAETCFCDSMGLDPQNSPTADIQLLEGDDAYSVVAQTEKGEKALESWKPFLSEGSVEVPKIECALKVDMTGVKDKLDRMFDHPIWEELSAKCLACGTCTYVCPTCHCFDISQENKMKDGVRFRCWDSCMFSEYTQMAGDHNPRPTKKERLRNRFMHKLCFFEDRYGKTLCVGCGRCVEKCPVSVDITCLIDQIGEFDV